MGISGRRKIQRTGKYTRTLSIPAGLKIGEFATLAGDRILLVDPRGEISKDDLLSFLEKFVEPELWSFLKALEVSK